MELKIKVLRKKLLSINENLEIFYSSYIPINLNEFKNKKLLAIAGIEIQIIFDLIEKNGLSIEKK